MRNISLHKNPVTRREFIQSLSLGSAGLPFALGSLTGCSSQMRGSSVRKRTSNINFGETTVSFVPGNDRRDMVYQSLKPFKEDIATAIADKQVMIKINCVVDSNPLIATHPDAVRGILDFLTPLYDRTIIIGESTASEHGTRLTFEQYGYFPLEKEYKVKLVELNEEPYVYQTIINHNLFPEQIRIIKPFLDPNYYIISVTRLKTHNAVVATLTLKNVVMGSPLKIPKQKINDKAKIHAHARVDPSPKFLNYNLFLLAHNIYPDFAVLDGFEGVEGNGPDKGTPVDHRVVVAGHDYLSVDRIGTELMGIPWEDIGYLQFCAQEGLGQGDRSKIRILGPNIEGYVRKYKLHENIQWQYSWKNDVTLEDAKK